MNRILFAIAGLIVLAYSPAMPSEAYAQSAASPKQRLFQLSYAVEVTGVAAGEKVKVWLPVPQSDDGQTVQVLSQKFPVETQTTIEPVHGNKIMFFEVPTPASGAIAGSMEFRVLRREVLGLPNERDEQQQALTPDQRQLFLAPNRKVPITGRPLDLLQGLTLPEDPLALARLFYDRVDDHVKYDKSIPGFGQGDVNWVCDSRTGNCTDFHSLFISWSRAHGLPARFEIGFPLPEMRGDEAIPGYHCWAYFYAQNQWIPVDISEADKNPALKEYYFGHLTENRVTFSTGRDLNLVPRQSSEPLNFFVYPHVEVAGKVLPREQVKLTVRFRDL